MVELRSHEPSGVAKFKKKKEKKKRDWLGLELDQDPDDTAGNKPGQSPQSSNSLTKPHLRHSVLPSGLRIQLPQPPQSPRAQGASRPLGALSPLFLPTHDKSATISLSSKLAKTVKVWVSWGPASLSNRPRTSLVPGRSQSPCLGFLFSWLSLPELSTFTG